VLFVLPLTAAYELEWSQDCGRMQLKSAVMDSIGVQRAPLVGYIIRPLPGSRMSASKALFLSKSVSSLVSMSGGFVHRPWSASVVKSPSSTCCLPYRQGTGSPHGWKAVNKGTMVTEVLHSPIEQYVLMPQSSERDEIRHVVLSTLNFSTGLGNFSENVSCFSYSAMGSTHVCISNYVCKSSVECEALIPQCSAAGRSTNDRCRRWGRITHCPAAIQHSAPSVYFAAHLQGMAWCDLSTLT
jgi:hypothetical protein